MKRRFTILTAALALLTFLAVPMGMWGQTTTVDVTLSSGTFNNNVITWTCADGNITIQQLKGSGSSNPNSSYISAPRVYKQNILSFVGTNGYTITNIDIKCDGSYYGTTKYAGTEISNNNVNNNTTALNPTWSTANGGTHSIATVSSDGISEIYIQNGHSSDNNSQLRITKITITYKVTASATATTVTINSTGLTNTDIYTSTTAGTLSASVTETESGNAISGATVTWSSSDTDVATIDNNGAVTLKAVGTTTITASYAGVTGTYGSSSATYELTVTSSEPYVQPTTIEIIPNYTFWGKTGQFSGSDNDELSGNKDNVTLDWSRGNGSTYANMSAMRFYKDNTLVFTAPTGYEIISIVITFTSTTYAPNDIAFSPTGYELDGTTGTWTGSSETVTMSRPSSASSYAQISKFTITLAEIGGAVATTTTINVPANFNTDIHNGTTAGTLTATVTPEGGSALENPAITWSSSNTGVATVDANGAVTLVAVGTTNITASYAGVTDQYRPSSDTYELTVIDSNAPGSQNNPYTVAQAIANTPSSGNVYIQGIVSSFYNTSIVGDGSNYRYYISDDGSTTTQLLVYKGKGLNQATFSNANDLLVGDEVVIYGSLITYQNAPEVASGNYLYSWNRPAAAVEAPVFSPVAGTYATAQSVTISCATTGATIYYTTDGTEPTTSSATYNGAISISTTTTIKAVAYVGTDHSSVATATYHINSQDNPYTVAQALVFNEYPANGIYVSGIVSTAPSQAPTNNGELTYYITDDGTTAHTQLEVYKGKGLNQAAFTAQDDIQVGDIVTVYGNVQIYNSTFEFAQGNYLVSFERPAQQYTLTVTCSANVEIFTFVDPNEQGVEGATTQQVTSGTEVGISVSAATGYTLSLTVDGADVTSQLDETGYYTFYMPSHNVTVTATASAAPVVTTNTYTLASSIESGKQYIIVGEADGNYYAMGENKGNNRNAYGITLNGTTATATVATGYNVHEFTISSLATPGFYSICDAIEPGYLYAGSSNGNQLKTEDELDSNHNGDWEISINAETGVASVVASQSSNRNVMQFNNSNILFNCYSSTSQHPVYLYVKDETPATETYTLTINGYTDVAEGEGTNNKGYYLIASPVIVDPATAGMTTGDYDLYYFEENPAVNQETGIGLEWINYEDENDGGFDLVPGKGYLYAKKAIEENQTYSFDLIGTPYAGNGTVELNYTEGAQFAGWNLVGNPFGTTATIDRQEFYVMNGDRSDLMAGTSSTIAPMQGIFVIAEEDGESVTFTESGPNTGGEEGEPLGKLALNLTKSASTGSTAVIDRAVVRFGEGRTLPKFQLNPDNTKIYITAGNQDFAVVRSNNAGEMPVSFKAAENGNYTLSVEAENVEASYLHLIDNMTGADVDLLATPSYSFEARTTDYANRFRLVFNANGVDENNATASFAYFNGSSWTVSNMGEATLQVVDMMGRVVSTQAISGNTDINLNQVPGVYMLRLVNGENVMVQKVVVR